MGDNPNDIEMLETAGWGIAVANAHESLKARASFCCAHHDRHAVSEVIGWIIGKRPGDGSPVW
jgi:hydroxymethylpyrimidine pyrophosphatase-like HAD family hydrolase